MTTPRPHLPLSSETAQAARRFRLVGIVLPIGIATAIAILQLALLPALPRDIAVHWGATGEADALGPAWINPLLTVAVGLLVTLSLGIPVLSAIRRATAPVRARLLAAASVFTASLVGLLTLGGMLIQLGLENPAAAPSIIPILLAAAVVALGLAALAWRLTSEPPVVTQPTVDPDPVRLSPGEQVVWMRDARMARAGRLSLLLLLLALATGAIILISTDIAAAGRVSPASWVLLGTAALIGVMIAGFTTFHVRVDRTGLTVRSALGWPRTHVAAADIAQAEMVDVNPLGEYGGWGWRLAPGSGTGIVMRAGEALRITRADGRMLTVTVDDAERAVALLRASTS